MNDEIKRRILALYAEVDAEIARIGPKCDASGRCCRFKEYGHTLFISQLEAAVLLESAPPFEQPVSDESCPFQKEDLCTARQPRPLGCRIYFCDPSYQETSFAITETYLRQLKKLAEEFETGWRYAPLHIFLNEAKTVENNAHSPNTTPASRIALPLVLD